MPFEDIKIIGMNEEKTRKSDQAPAMFDVALQLSAAPPAEWVASFEHGWKNSIWYNMKRHAWIEGANIVVTCVPDEVQPHHIPQLTRAIAETNKEYHRLLSQHQAAKLREQEQRVNDTKKISDLKQSLKFGEDNEKKK